MTTPPAQRYDRTASAITDLPWPRALQVLSTDGSRTLISTGCLLIGWSFSETTGTAIANLALFNGQSSAGSRVASIGMVAGGGSNAGPGWPGIPVPDGLYVATGAGAFRGAVWVIPVIGGMI